MERLRLLRLALAGEPRYEIDDLELRRGGVSYTIDTVREFTRRFPAARLVCLVGADHVASLCQWREAEELAALTEFLVIPRPGHADSPLPPPFRGRMLQGFALGVSASRIRERIRAGRTIEHLVPREVAEAIRNYHLYL